MLKHHHSEAGPGPKITNPDCGPWLYLLGTDRPEQLLQQARLAREHTLGYILHNMVPEKDAATVLLLNNLIHALEESLEGRIPA